MMPVVLSPMARQDLTEIWEYVAARHLDAAERLIEALKEAFDRLCAYPQLGHLRPDLTPHPVRFLSVKGYLIVYHIEPTAVLVLRVISGYQDVAMAMAETP